MARRPKPEALKIIEGTFRKDRQRKDQPTPTSALPKTAPKAWPKETKPEYARIKKALDELGAATAPDLESIRLYCESAADYQAAIDELDGARRWYEVTTKSGGTMIREHPAVKSKAAAEARMKGWLVEHGLTPAARTRVSVAKPKDKKDDPAAKYLGKEGRRA